MQQIGRINGQDFTYPGAVMQPTDRWLAACEDEGVAMGATVLEKRRLAMD